MDFEFNDTVPIYIQLIDKFKIAIATNCFKAGEKIPSVREFSMNMRVNPNTIQRALNELEKDGFIYTKRTLGKFIVEDENVLKALKSTIAHEKIDSFVGSMQELNYNKMDIIKMIKESEE